jgi:TRAP transporter TAXI family solute receptor
MDPYQAAHYARQIADAIAHAHEQGVVHRDLKPANVLVNQQDQVVVTDFGLAKTLGTESGITETGATLGTPSYMSPEQAGGKTQEHAEPTDIYAIGAILFAMLAGRPPFSAPSPMQTLMQVLHQAPPRLRSIAPWTPVDLQTIVEKCLAKQPSKRYPSARALADELDRFLQHQPIEAKPPKAWQRAIQWMLRIPIIAALSGHRSSDPSPAHRWAQRGLIAIFALIPFFWFFGTSWYRNHKQQVLPESIVIAGGAAGGIYQEVAQQLAERLTQHVPSQVVALPTEGSADNLQRLVSGNVQLALLQSSSIQSGEVLVVTPLYQEALHLLVRSDLPWQGFPSLKGRRLAVGPLNSGSRQAAQWVLDFHGIDPSQLELLPWDPGQLPGEPPADAALLMIKPGASTIARLLGNQSYRLLSIPDSLEITEEQPALRVVEIQRFDYPNNSQFDAITTVGATAFLTCSSRAPNRLVQETLEAIYGGNSRLPGTLPLEKAQQFRGLPLHPAARAFFDTRSDRGTSGISEDSKALSK